MPNDDYQMELCSLCINAFEQSLTYKVKLLKPYRKCVCGNCGKKGYGAFCSVEQVNDKLDKMEPLRAYEIGGRT